MTPQDGTPEQLKAWHRRVVEELWNNGNLDLIDVFLDPSVEGRGQAKGMTREDARRIVQEFRKAFPDMHVTIDKQIAEGNELSTFSTIRGTHRAEFQGMRASGKPVELTTACHLTFADGKIVEQNVTFDEAAFRSQLR